jgi:hypothetical protein
MTFSHHTIVALRKRWDSRGKGWMVLVEKNKVQCRSPITQKNMFQNGHQVLGILESQSLLAMGLDNPLVVYISLYQHHM